ncbi:hypothetical protein AAC387_Pa02g2840 [Persea americana]
MPLQAVSCKHLCSLQFSSLDSPIARRPSISTASCKHRPLSTKSRPDQTRPDQSRVVSFSTFSFNSKVFAVRLLRIE